MANEEVEELRSRLLGPDRDERLGAVEELDDLPPTSARQLLREGMRHWDRDVRRQCAKKLFEMLGSRGASEILKAGGSGLMTPRATAWILSTAPSLALIDRALKEAANRVHPVFTPFLVALRDHPRVQRWKAKQEGARRRELVKRERQLLAEQEKTEAARKTSESAEAERKVEQAQVVDSGGLDALFSGRESLLAATFGEWRRDHDCFAARYTRAEIPKKSGGIRVILAPELKLKLLQRLLLDKYLSLQPLHPACHGFRAGRSTRTAAEPHVGHAILVNLDLRDFFPSITSPRVAGVFGQLKAPGGTVGRAFLVDLVTCGDKLPQGAPTSPCIANLVCRRMDSRLAGLLAKVQGTYTRYADDLTFSGPKEVLALLPRVRSIVKDEGFEIAREKTRILRRGVRQEVTGLTVNDRVSVPRALRRRIRAAVHAAKLGRPLSWKGREVGRATIRGHIAYMKALHPEEAARLLERLSAASQPKP